MDHKSCLKNSNAVRLNNSKYLKNLKDAMDDLKEKSDELFSTALHLALTGEWKGWEASMPVGTNITFNEEMLFKTGDVFVKDLTKLRMDMLDEAEKIKSYLDNQRDLNTTAKSILTGHKKIDKATGGLKVGDVIALTGSSSNEAALRVITKVAFKDNVNCGILSLNRSKEQIVRQMLSLGSRVGLQKITGGKVASREWPKLENTADKLSDSPIYIKDKILTVFDVEFSIRHVKTKLDLLMVDGYKKSIPVKSLKRIATDYQLPIIVTTKGRPSTDFDKVISV